MTLGPTVDRVPPLKPLSIMQRVVADLFGIGLSGPQIARQLKISLPMVREHADRACEKIPGDLPRVARLVAWTRGATLDVLCGHSLRRELTRKAQQAEWSELDTPSP